MTTACGGCHPQGGCSAPIAFCAEYGGSSGTKSVGAALVARNLAYQNTACDVLGACLVAGVGAIGAGMAKLDQPARPSD